MKRAITVLATTGIATVLLAAPALAHVTVHVDNATRGASDVAVTFRVPNERDNANTTKIQAFFPTDTPLLGVLVQPHPGWTSKVTTKKLAKPVTTDDGTITEAVYEVDWTADSKADALQPGQSGDFVVTAGQLPDVATVTFKALQTYSSGEIVRWIEIASPGSAEPDFPAPTLTLTAANAPVEASNPVSAPSLVPPIASIKAKTDGLGIGLGIAALVVALGALAAALRPKK